MDYRVFWPSIDYYWNCAQLVDVEHAGVAADD
jgi:hypothetical protein